MRRLPALNVTGSILAVGRSLKTEYMEFETALTDTRAGTRAAKMRMLPRSMKASSPLYAK